MLRQFRFMFSPHPVYMVFWVTRQCNLSCSHCFNHDWTGSGEADLSLQEIRAVSNGLGHIKYLTLAGGEPFLRDDLPEIIGQFHRANDLHVVNLVTNGWHTDRIVSCVREVLKHCRGLHVSVGVSVDGPETVHDQLRRRAGSYRRAVRTVSELNKLVTKDTSAKKNLTVGVCGTYSSANAKHLVPLARYFHKTHQVPFYAGLIRGKTLPDQALKEIDIDHYKQVLNEISFMANRDLAGNYPFRHIRIAVDEVASDMIVDSVRFNRKTVTCKAGKKGFVLTADGEVLLCEVLNTSLGNVRDTDYSVHDILSGNKACSEMEMIRKQKCHCTWECFMRLNTVFSPELYPKVLLKIYTSLL